MTIAAAIVPEGASPRHQAQQVTRADSGELIGLNRSEREGDMGAFWHPFADMVTVSSSELVIDRGDGYMVTTHQARSTSTPPSASGTVTSATGVPQSSRQPRHRCTGSPRTRPSAI